MYKKKNPINAFSVGSRVEMMEFIRPKELYRYIKKGIKIRGHIEV